MFDLGSDNQDYIEIYVGSTDISNAIYYGRFSYSNSIEGRILFSTNNQMIIILRSDSRTRYDGRGFSILRLPCKYLNCSRTALLWADNRSWIYAMRFLDSVPSFLVNEDVEVTIGATSVITSPEFNTGNGELPSFSGFWTVSAPAPIYQLIIEVSISSIYSKHVQYRRLARLILSQSTSDGQLVPAG